MLDGRTIGKYRILEQIGRGGMGTVYKAVDETLDRVVAIKMINADNMSAERMQRFRSEAVTLAKLTHPRIATIHELARDEHDFLMVMEYVPGETLEKIVTDKGALPLAQAVTLCEQVLDALGHAHSAGIVHRDLKPSNLMVTPSGDVKVMDFGIARIAGSEHLTTDGYMMGTPAYMSPEQVRGAEVDARMDLYAIAVVLYRLLTNSLPFRAETPVQLIQSQLMDQPTPPRQIRPDLPPWIDEVLLYGLAKTPEQRFQTAAEFRLALQRGLSGAVSPVTGSMPQSLFDTSAQTFAVITPVGLRNPPSQSMPIGTPSGAMRASSSQMPLAYPTPGTMPSASMPVPQAPAAQAAPTVTLRRQHLALGAGLLALLVVVVGVLAYVALRRPSVATTVATNDASTSAPANIAPAAPAAAPAASTEAPSAGGPGASPSSSTTSPSGGASTAAATPTAASTTPPANASSTSAAARGGAPAAPGAPPATTAPATTKGRSTAGPNPVPAPAAKDATAATSKPGAAPTPAPIADTAGRSGSPAVAADASAPAESFGDVKALMPQGADGARGRETDVLLGLEPGRLIVRSRASGAVLKNLPYASIAAATYVRDKRPKGSDDTSLAAVPENFGGSGFFLGSAKNWLTLQTKSEFLILRLEDRNMRSITLAIESRTGVTTQRVEQKPDKDEGKSKK